MVLSEASAVGLAGYAAMAPGGERALTKREKWGEMLSGVLGEPGVLALTALSQGVLSARATSPQECKTQFKTHHKLTHFHETIKKKLSICLIFFGLPKTIGNSFTWSRVCADLSGIQILP